MVIGVKREPASFLRRIVSVILFPVQCCVLHTRTCKAETTIDLRTLLFEELEGTPVFSLR